MNSAKRKAARGTGVADLILQTVTCEALLEPADLELIHLTKRYGAATAVDAIDLKVPARAYCCLLGPSGCGKTTTLRMIAGHERVTKAMSSLARPTSPTCRRPSAARP